MFLLHMVKTGGALVGNKNADGLEEHTAPAGFQGLGNHVIVAAHR